MKSLPFIIFLFLSFFVDAQPGFVQSAPDVVNFSRKDYQGGSQTQGFAQFSNGFIGAANNDGLLIFDGITWSLYPQPNSTILRSILVQGDSIFCGGQNELGYFTFNNGGATYHSLINLLPTSNRNIGEVWDVLASDGKLYFRCTTGLAVYDGHSLSMQTEPNITSIAFYNKQLIIATTSCIHTLQGDTIS